MSVYCESLGTFRDGKCGCGKDAEIEIQVGWNTPSKGVGGGQYEEMCEDCFLIYQSQREQDVIDE